MHFGRVLRSLPQKVRHSTEFRTLGKFAHVRFTTTTNRQTLGNLHILFIKLDDASDEHFTRDACQRSVEGLVLNMHQFQKASVPVKQSSIEIE